MIGASVLTRGGLSQGLAFAEQNGCTALQLYVASSRRWEMPPLLSEDISNFLNAGQSTAIDAIVAHASLLLNLASNDTVIYRKSIDRLIQEAERCRQLGIKEIVVHPGSNEDRRGGIVRIIRGLEEVLARTSQVRVLLETVAGQGVSIGASFNELATILQPLRHSGRVGVCFDTCHVFAAGYDIRGYQGYEQVMNEFEQVIGLAEIKVFHVNDSKTDFGRRVDRHAEIIGDGYIGRQTFHALMHDVRFQDRPMIAEVPDTEKLTKVNVDILKFLRSSNISEGSGRGQLSLL